MSARLSRNNIKAGLFAVVAIAAFMIVLLQVGDFWKRFTERRTEYVFWFSIEDGAMGLKKGAVVKVGGQPVGEVTTVGFKKPSGSKRVSPRETVSYRVAYPVETGTGEAPEPREAVYVVVSLKNEVTIYRNAKVYLELPLLGNVSTINIPDVGGGEFNEPSPEGGEPRRRTIGKLEEMEIIPGTLAPPAFLGQAGYGAEQKDQLQVILQRGSEIANQVKEMVQTTQGRLEQTMASVEDAAKNLSTATGLVNGRLPNWLDLVEAMLTSAGGAAEEGRQRLIEAKALVAVGRNILDDNRVNIDRMLAGTARAAENAADLTHKLNTELYGVVRDALVDGRKVLGRSAEVVERVDRFMQEKTPDLGRMVANARLASDQLKLAMTEVRRNPWRLLYQPTRREIEEELTYDTARTYAEAVGQLRSGTEALEAVMGASGGASLATLTLQQQEQLKHITAEIQQSFAKYQDAERKFLDRLTRER